MFYHNLNNSLILLSVPRISGVFNIGFPIMLQFYKAIALPLCYTSKWVTTLPFRTLYVCPTFSNRRGCTLYTHRRSAFTYSPLVATELTTPGVIHNRVDFRTSLYGCLGQIVRQVEVILPHGIIPCQTMCIIIVVEHRFSKWDLLW